MKTVVTKDTTLFTIKDSPYIVQVTDEWGIDIKITDIYSSRDTLYISGAEGLLNLVQVLQEALPTISKIAQKQAAEKE